MLMKLWDTIICIIKHEWSTFQNNLSSRFLDFWKSTKNQQLAENYNGSDLKKKSRSWDRENENQQNFHGFET